MALLIKHNFEWSFDRKLKQVEMTTKKKFQGLLLNFVQIAHSSFQEVCITKYVRE